MNTIQLRTLHLHTVDPMSADIPRTRDITLTSISFDELYRREYPGLVAVATALSGYDGEDLVQDAMVKALTHWEKVQRLERPGGWCHRVLVNLCRNRWKRRRTAARYLERRRREVASTPGPSADALAFWAAVRQLPERPRLAVTLHYAGERQVAEIAELLSVPEGTIRSDLSRARIAIVRELGGE
jgi:RNA polymerase sigma-70 factor (ECF subfamily)